MIRAFRYTCLAGAAFALAGTAASAQTGGETPGGPLAGSPAPVESASDTSWMNDAEFWVAPPRGAMKTYHDYSNIDWLVSTSIPVDGINWSSVSTVSSPYNIGYMFTDCDGTVYQVGRIYPHESISYYEGIKAC